MENITLLQGDCLELLNQIPEKSIDLIVADLPFGSTKSSWDSLIPIEVLWTHYKRIIKPNRAICLHATQPFASMLVQSNLDWYKYEWVWNKKKPSNFLLSKIMPLMSHETIQVFGNGKVLYNPQMTKGRLRNKTPQNKEQFKKDGGWGSNVKFQGRETINDLYYPKSIIEISNANQRGKIHSTQKPIELAKYLIMTYSNIGDAVLDCTMGSGTVGCAAKETGRKFIGIEKNLQMFLLAKDRISKHVL